MGIDAALADQSQMGQAIQEVGADAGAFAEQNERFGLLHPLG